MRLASARCCQCRREDLSSERRLGGLLSSYVVKVDNRRSHRSSVRKLQNTEARKTRDRGSALIVSARRRHYAALEVMFFETEEEMKISSRSRMRTGRGCELNSDGWLAGQAVDGRCSNAISLCLNGEGPRVLLLDRLASRLQVAELAEETKQN